MKYFVLLSGLLLSLFAAYAQTSLSGQINVYTTLTGQDACTNTITVENADEFAPGMGLIIIQMSGANIDLSNSSAYGNVTDRNGAGQYEYNRIMAIDGDVLTLESTLLHQYSTDATQVVGFSIYENTNVDGTLVPAAWNGTTGGVLALEVSGTLTLNASIDAGGRGFRGGAAVFDADNSCNFLTNADDYAYSATNWRGAPKGEGIGNAAPGEPYGRGAQANGGGGGNDHNSGGGGGSLLSAGGQGGTNEEPSTFGCDGDYPGRGGKVLPNDNTLAFLGGGGGSGHANNLSMSGGGNGGGLVFIKATNIVFAGGGISANGASALNAIGDGGGGGGAGGGIFLIASTVEGTPQLSASGGAGGGVDNGNNERCFGPGGGGGGGVLWSNQSLSADLNGGNAGMSLNSTVCNNTTNGATNGTAGLTGTLLAFPQGDTFNPAGFTIDLATIDTTLCNGTPLDIVADINGMGFTLQWQANIDDNWENIVEIPGQITGTQTNTLQFTEAISGEFRLLLLPESDCFDEVVSSPVTVAVIAPPAAAPSFTTNGNTVEFLANTSSGEAWEWTFLPDQSSTEENPSFTFPGPGTYNVSLSVSNACGTVSYTLNVDIATPLVAQIGSSGTVGCAPLSVLFTDESTGGVTSRLWTFAGGEPASSTDSAPVVSFAEVGTYEVTLTVSNGSSEVSATQSIAVVPPPLPAFTVASDELTITLNNNSQNADGYLWNFGDGNTSTLENPVHTYGSPGVYEVSLNASNEFCAVAIAQTISVATTATQAPTASLLRISPNPTGGPLRIDHWERGVLRLYHADGRPLRQWGRPQPTIDLSEYPAGVYLLRHGEQGRHHWWRVVKI